MGARDSASKVIPWDLMAKVLGNHPRPDGSINLDNYFSTNPNKDCFTSIHPAERVGYADLPDLGQKWPRFFKTLTSETVPGAGVAELHDCRYWGHYGGTVVTSSEFVLEEFSREVWQIEKNKIFHRPGLPQPATLSGTTAVLTCRGAESNFYHWTIDLLPRILLLKEFLGGLETIDHFLINHRGTPFQLETLEEVGVPLDKVIAPTAKQHLRLQRAFIPTCKEPLGPVASWMIDSLRSLGPYESHLKSKRIFISRKPSSGRNIENEVDLLRMLQARGFTKVCFEDHTVREQRALCANAEQIVGIHGAGLANLAWAKPGSLCVEIFTPKLLDLAFRRICNVGQMSYAALLAEGEPSRAFEERTDFYRPIRVSVDLVEAALELAT